MGIVSGRLRLSKRLSKFQLKFLWRRSSRFLWKRLWKCLVFASQVFVVHSAVREHCWAWAISVNCLGCRTELKMGLPQRETQRDEMMMMPEYYHFGGCQQQEPFGAHSLKLVPLICTSISAHALHMNLREF